MRILAFIGGFLLALATQTIFGSIAIPVMSVGVGVATYHLFITRSQLVGSTLVGAALCFELLGTHRPGIFLLIVLIMHITRELAPHTLRFTDPFTQYAILNIVHMTVFVSLILPPNSLLHTLSLLLVMIAICLVWAYSAYTTRASKQISLT